MTSFKLCFLLLALLLASATLSLGSRDPRREESLKQCKQQCQQERQPDSRRCIQQCQEKARQGGDPESEIEYVESDIDDEQKQGRNPYVFEDRHFITGLQTQHGRLRTLPKFSQRSSLLKGIKNYRVAILEADPHTFVLPTHLDAESIVFVAKGKGTVSSIQQERRESYNIKEGDIFRVKAGTTSYLINRDNRDKLVLVELLQPVNTPGVFVPFFGAGGENPESFYRAFSNEILEAAFNTRSDKLEKVLGQQKQGAIIKASEAQIKALSQGEGGKFPFPFPAESKETHNIYEQRPERRNQYGQLFEVNQNQFRQLRDLDLAVSLANISQGAMTAPHYNSRATKISIVVGGEGYFEMACPHLSHSQSPPHRGSRGDESQESRRRGEESQESRRRGEESQESRRRGEESQESQQQGSTGYRKIRANLKVGTVVVVPAGHPFVAVASNNQNLQLLCFEVNAYNNDKYTLAGKRNVISQFENEAKQLAFGVPAREVDEVFNSQQEDFFFKGPRQQGRAEA